MSDYVMREELCWKVEIDEDGVINESSEVSLFRDDMATYEWSEIDSDGCILAYSYKGLDEAYEMVYNLCAAEFEKYDKYLDMLEERVKERYG